MSEFDMKLLIEELQERNDNLNKENNELSLKNQRLHNVLDKIKEYIENPRHEMSVKTFQELSKLLEEIE
jgi:hypothetical protein